MRFVPIKTDDQLDLQALHRVRDRLMTRRTALINQIRAFLLERGIVFAKSPIRLREALPEVLENVNENLTPRMRNLVAMLWSEWKDLELQIVQMNDEVERIASSDVRVGDCGRSLASDRWLQPRSWPPSATAQPSARGGSSRPGWGTTEPAFDRWQGEVVWNQQARQLLPAQDPDSWSTRGRIAIQAGPNRDGRLDDLA
jgi:Transposase.